MTNTAIVSIYGQLVALTLELDKAITEKLDSRGFLLLTHYQPKEIQPCISASSLSVTHFVHEG
jgi:hypothetical protein